MNYEQMFAACNALSEAKLMQRKPNDWYVQQSVEVKSGLILAGRYGNGANPVEAIENHWAELTNLAPGEYLVIDAFNVRGGRRAVKWNGFMWEDVVEPKRDPQP